MDRLKKYVVIICSIWVFIIVVGIHFLNEPTVITFLEKNMMKDYPNIKSVYSINVGPNCSIIYHVEKNTSLEMCKEIFYDTSDMIYEEKMYKALEDIHKLNTGDYGIIFLKIKFTTKDADSSRHGLICEFELKNPPGISQEYDIENAVWRWVDDSFNELGEIKASDRMNNK